ncbi:hypothetical protein IAR55_005749 [Kwoniella newhampshirensis]|uniref:Uncharacterized protein n=1 Tax=Kwoniella newhampshirensis TaxID=1651941 RepID=A0AAW0YVJ9_9TREE
MPPPRPLHIVSQQIHATLLSPPSRFLLVSTLSDSGQGDGWTLSLFSRTGQGVRIWSETLDLSEVDVPEGEIGDAIQNGMLHVDCGCRRQVDLDTLKEVSIHILVRPKPIVVLLVLSKLEEHASELLDSSFQLLSRPDALSKESNLSEIKELRAKLSQRENEIHSLNSKLASMKATVVRATSSDNKSKFPPSPQKAAPPKGASQLQPNQKRRKAVEDEFAGSSDDEDED